MGTRQKTILRTRCSRTFSHSLDPRRTSQSEVDRLASGTPRLTLLLKFAEGRMSRMTVLVLAVLGSLYLSGQALAQLTPPAGSAGAGKSPIRGRPLCSAHTQGLSHPHPLRK